MTDHDSPHDDSFQKPQSGWVGKFANAIRGIGQGISGQSSFLVHIVAAVAVVVMAAFLALPLEHWCLLLICIGTVLGAELFNSSLEFLAASITDRFDSDIQKALNIASGSVLVVAVFAAIVGGLIFLNAMFDVTVNG